jgi:phenylalanyl-tRNA synthetase beta chain
MNPLREEDAHMRTSLVPALLENLRRNFTRGVRDIRLFETSRVFFAEEHGGLPAEPARLGGVFFRQKSYLFWKEPEGDFYGVKGALEGLFEHFRIEGVSLGPCAEPFLHPGKSADIFLSGKRAGFAGVVLPAIKESFEVKAKEDVVVFELDLDLIFESLPPAPRYRALPKYPYIERDIAVVVDEVVKAADILKEIRSYPSPLVEDASVFDLYKGDKVEKGKKSLAFNIRYRAKDRTLTEEELEPVHRTLVEHVLKATGGRLRE